MYLDFLTPDVNEPQKPEQTLGAEAPELEASALDDAFEHPPDDELCSYQPLFRPINDRHSDPVLDQIATRAYEAERLRGIANLSRDRHGRVHWRGAYVQTQAFPDDGTPEATEAAHRLAACCRTLEAAGELPSYESVQLAYRQAEFGEGLDLPRAVVLYFVERGGAHIEVRALAAQSVLAADAEIGRLSAEFLEQHNPRLQHRCMRLVNAEDLQEVLRAIGQDCQFARFTFNWPVFYDDTQQQRMEAALAAWVPAGGLPTTLELQDVHFSSAVRDACAERIRERC
ncbi:hypothetical protein [Ramlibacter sp. AN1133]|uniref:hypothetical protein n=1 Tax=Ramlibacter sp. AN1133 TaxID=3133429 RepID=UPI0030BA9DA1